MTTTRPLSWPAIAMAASALLAFVVVCGTRPVSLVALTCFMAGLALRGRMHLDVRPQVVVASLILVATWMLAGGGLRGTGMIGDPTGRLALGFNLVCAAGLTLTTTRMRERGYCCLAVATMMFSLMSTILPPHIALIPVALQMLALALVLRSQIEGAPQSPLSLVLLIPTTLATLLLSSLLQWSETKVNLLFSLVTPPPGMSFAFTSKTKLSSMTRAYQNPAVVARYFSDRPATHLVARCYSTYQEGGVWVSPEATRTVDAGSDGFPLFSPKGSVVSETIEFAGPSRDALFPRDAAALLLPRPQAVVSLGECYALPAKEHLGRYGLRRTPGEFPREFGQDDRTLLLQVPPSLRAILKQTADSWSPSPKDSLQRCSQLEAYLQDHFKYGFGYPFGDKQEPILSFLEDRPPSHCELFAATLALMLRCYDIPTRYVNGFLAVEHAPLGGYAILRHRHAHAWVEAYIDGYGWIGLDPTPPQYLQREDDLLTRLRGLSDLLFHYLGRLTRLSWQELLQGVLALAKKAAVPVAAVLVLVWLAQNRHLFRPHRPQRSTSSSEVLTPEELQTILDEVEAAAARRGLVRPPQQTLRQWELLCGQPLGAFLALYQRLRYAQSQVAPDQLSELRQRAAEVLNWAHQPGQPG